MSAARRCSRSNSRRRYSRSHTRDRHSRSNCCSTAEGHGSWTVYLSAKLQIFCETRLAYGEKREREQPFGSPSDAFSRFFALRCPLLSEYDHAPEGQPHAAVRVRTRGGANRARTHETATRERIAVRPQRDTASIGSIPLPIGIPFVPLAVVGCLTRGDYISIAAELDTTDAIA